jgi:hypothetical protein
LAAFAQAARQNVSLIFTFNPERSVRERFIQDTIDVVAKKNGAVVFVELTCRGAGARTTYGRLLA